MKNIVSSKAEAALAQRAKHLDESHLHLTTPERLVRTQKDYIE